MNVDLDALIAEARKLLFSDSAFGYEDTKEGDLISRLADTLESVYADSLTAQAEHARWQERAEKAERAGERILADALARSAELRQERERADNYRLGAQLGTTRNKEFNEAQDDLARAREVIENAKLWLGDDRLTPTQAIAGAVANLATYDKEGNDDE